MFKHILLPTDGSPLSAAAIRQGIRFAKSIGAKVTGLCVMPLQHPFFYETEIPMEFVGARRQAVQGTGGNSTWRRLKKRPRKRELRATSFTRRTIIPTRPSSGLAKQKSCDLIMMASHGRKGVGALLLGSETQKVLTHSRIPVLVYR